MDYDAAGGDYDDYDPYAAAAAARLEGLSMLAEAFGDEVGAVYDPA